MNNKEFDAVRMKKRFGGYKEKVRDKRKGEREMDIAPTTCQNSHISFYLPEMMSFLKNKTVQVL